MGARLTAKTSQDYLIGPEDLVEIMVYGEEDRRRTVRVNGQGQINMPLVGTVKVGSMTPREVEAKLVEMYGERFIKDPQVSVFVKEYRHSRVALTGALKTPGFYELIGPRSLMEMLAMAGGLNSMLANPSGVTILRMDEDGQAVSLPANVGRIIKKQEPDIVLKENDVVFVPESVIRKFLVDFRQLVGGGMSVGYTAAP